ncbi:MAG: tetratricopeptide repeat protein [Balneolaceae bacterium]|nr:tetratricopeptide repeat protein [Balneolaceae bacterium]
MVKKHLFILCILVLGAQEVAIAQVSTEFQLGLRLMQKQQYEKALPLLKEAAEEEPDNYAYADRLIECYIHLKEYDHGIQVAQRLKKNPEFLSRANVRLGELYHFNKDTARAYQIWTQNIEQHPRQLQLYVNTGRTMIEREEYLKAIEVYKMGRINFKNERLFFGDIANAYLRAGNYENTIKEWINLLKDAPNQAGYIKRTLLRYDDPILYDITIIELDERLSSMAIDNAAYPVFYNLLVWLLQENSLYRRALVTAKEYESRSSSYNLALFNLGKQLTENKEFALAKDAFHYYIDNAMGEMKWRSMHELSNTYSRWAKYLEDYSLDFNSKRDSLYTLAFKLLNDIESETSNYSRMEAIYIRQAELSLDHIFDLEEAKKAIKKLKRIPGKSTTPHTNYLDGRIHLSNEQYPEARIKFTQANKKARIGSLAEKTRYFLALTDFYAGDYEFSKIQLKTLGRQNTSYYANNALELRLWLQEGLAADSTGSELDTFSEAVFKYNNGAPKESTREFLSIIDSETGFQSLKDDALLFFVESRFADDSTKFKHLTMYMGTSPVTPVKEKLLWEQAKIAEKIDIIITSIGCETTENCFFSPGYGSDPVSAQDLYEELILSFPQGFYAPYARERLTELSRENS